MLAGSCKVKRWLWVSRAPEVPNLPATEVLQSLGESLLSALRENSDHKTVLQQKHKGWQSRVK